MAKAMITEHGKKPTQHRRVFINKDVDDDGKGNGTVQEEEEEDGKEYFAPS